MGERFQIRHKFESNGRHSTRLVVNQPDRPTTTTSPLRQLAVCVEHGTIPPSNLIGQRTITRGWQWPRSVPLAIPTSEKPILQHKRIGVAGGRDVGGGISREATRRQRKKAARRNRA